MTTERSAWHQTPLFSSFLLHAPRIVLPDFPHHVTEQGNRRASAYPRSSAAAHCGMRDHARLCPDAPPLGVIRIGPPGCRKNPRREAVRMHPWANPYGTSPCWAQRPRPTPACPRPSRLPRERRKAAKEGKPVAPMRSTKLNGSTTRMKIDHSWGRVNNALELTALIAAAILVQSHQRGLPVGSYMKPPIRE